MKTSGQETLSPAGTVVASPSAKTARRGDVNDWWFVSWDIGKLWQTERSDAGGEQSILYLGGGARRHFRLISIISVSSRLQPPLPTIRWQSYFYFWRGLTFITEMSFFHVVHNPNIAIFNNCTFTSFRFLKILRYFNISAAPPTTPKQLNDKCKYGLYKQTFTLDITIYVVKLCSDIWIDSKSITI